MEGDVVGNKILSQRSDNVRNYEEAILAVKEYGTIIMSKKKRTLNVVYRQGFLFKRFKESSRRLKLVSRRCT